jgi:hypothetical protein
MCIEGKTMSVHPSEVAYYLSRPGNLFGPCEGYTADEASHIYFETNKPFFLHGVGFDFDETHFSGAPGNVSAGERSHWLVVRTNQSGYKASNARIYTGGGVAIVTSLAPAESTTDADVDSLKDSWENNYWPSAATASASSDSDADGLTELQELAFGLNPLVPDSALQPRPVVEAGYLTMTITKRPGATYVVESAGSLVPLDSAPYFSAASTTVLVDEATTLKVRDNVSVTSGQRRYMKVRVNSAP